MEALVQGYRSGLSVYDLAARFGVHRTTISGYLHRQGVSMRRQGLDGDAIAQAARRYGDGWSLARIADHLHVDTTTVWTTLKARGVPMRDTHGRPR